MNEEIIDIIDDRLEKRFESYAQTQVKLHGDAHRKILEAVKEEIRVTVNGKIDKIQRTLDDRLTPFEERHKWWNRFKDGLTWVAGFAGSLAVIGGVIVFIFKFLLDYINK